MTKKEYKVFIARIEQERLNVNKLLQELKQKNLLDDRIVARQALTSDPFLVRGSGSVLHDFYVSIENILETIAKEIDESLPEGKSYHMDLLKQMGMPIQGLRPAVISNILIKQLDKYRGFRHVFRNVYGFNLDITRMEELLLDLPETIEQLEQELAEFISVLDESV